MMRRILHITGSMDRAGAETMIMNLYRAIDKTKFQFDFLYFTSKKCDYDDEIHELGGETYRILDSNPFRRMNATTKLLKQNPKWEIVHAHNLFSNAFHMYAAFKAGVRQRITHSHSTNTKDGNKYINYLYHSISRKIQIKYATHFAACSEAAGIFMFPTQKNVKVIKNSIDINYFVRVAGQSKHYLRNQFDISENSIVLLQLGRLTHPKNHLFSIKIAKELKNKNILFKLFFAGMGPLFEELKDLVKAMDLEEEIVFLGLRSDIPQLLAGSDLMLMPSLFEGFGLAIVEAQACGVPSLISTSIPADSDVKIDLVNFCSLETQPAIWAEKVIEICKSEIIVSNENRILNISKRGFDNYNNAIEIQEFYSN